MRLTFPNLYYTVLLTISEGNLLTWRKMEERVGHKSRHQTGSMFPSQGSKLFHCSLSMLDAAKFCFLLKNTNGCSSFLVSPGIKMNTT